MLYVVKTVPVAPPGQTIKVVNPPSLNAHESKHSSQSHRLKPVAAGTVQLDHAQVCRRGSDTHRHRTQR